MLKFAAVLTFALTQAAAAQTAQDPWPYLVQAHPRIMLSPSILAELKQRLASDVRSQQMLKSLRSQASRVIPLPPVVYPVGTADILATSREAEYRILLLSFLYRVDGNVNYANRARKELIAVSQFQNWNPAHFLDTAEMTYAVGIGYDWLSDVLPANEKMLIHQAIVSKGLKPGLTQMQQGEWWLSTSNNWAAVCQGSLTVGALAVASEEPALARAILAYTLKGLKPHIGMYNSDGGSSEGPTYWNYATGFLTAMIATLQTSFPQVADHDPYFGLLPNPTGFARAGYFRIYDHSPDWLAFNFADSWSGIAPSPQMFWFGQRFHTAFGGYETRVVDYLLTNADRPNDISPFYLLWYRPSFGTQGVQALAGFNRVRHFPDLGLSSFRASWKDSAGIFLAAKGGQPLNPHSHLDFGSFVLDFNGKRFVTDPGADAYDLPSYFSYLRYTYYRPGLAGHNILTPAGAVPKISDTASAPLLESGERGTSAHPYAIYNLDSLYPGRFSSWRRGFDYSPNQVVIQDEFKRALAGQEAVWSLHTTATPWVSSDGRYAILESANQRLRIEVVGGAGPLKIINASRPGAPNADNPNLSVLQCTSLPASSRIVISITTANSGPPDEPPPTVSALSAWKAP
jgi:hypothetical protein